MKVDTMAKFPGLSLRAGTYQLRVVIPKDLQAAYGGHDSIRESLKTSNQREAHLKAASRRGELLQQFKGKRRELHPQPLNEVPKELASELAQRVYAAVLRGDDFLRDTEAGHTVLAELSSLVQGLYSPLRLSGALPSTDATEAPSRSSLDGMNASEAATLASMNEFREMEAAVSLAIRQRSAILPMVMHEARKLGLSFAADAPGAAEALTLALQHYRQATLDAVGRDSGSTVETPAVAVGRKAALKPLKLRDVFTRWKVSKTRSEDSVRACERALVLYEEFTKDPELTLLNREQGDGFRAFLIAKGGASKTASDRLTWVKSLLKYAAQDLELIPRHPWAGLDIESQTTTKRKPWSEAQLSKLFSAPLFTSYALPNEWRAGKDAAYWIPIMALYTGSRVSELAQLRTVDIDAESDIPMLNITEDGEGQRVKSEAGHRSIPIHSELIRLGFLEYFKTVPVGGSLWPALKLRKNKPGGYFSDWFGVYRKSQGLLHDLHSFRHTVRSALVEAELTEPMIDRLCGHESAGSTGARVYTHFSPKALSKALEVLQFVKPPRVYNAA